MAAIDASAAEALGVTSRAMTRSHRGLVLAPFLFAPVAACGSTPMSLEDAGVVTEDASVDAGSPLDAPPRPPDAALPPDAAPRGDAGPQPAFEVARDREWHYVEVPGAVCANGTPMGIALNLDPTSDRLVVFLQGGGACWNAATCIVLGSAAHLTDTLTESIVLAEASRAGGFTLSRADGENPYRDQNLVYVPYCTADVHVGDVETTYRTPRTSLTVHHRGAANTEMILARLATTFPALDRLTMIGESAGGYGVAVNGFRGRLAFPGARVDVLDDSGLIVDANPDQWTEMMENWRPPLPADCPDCLSMLTNLIPYHGRTLPEGTRFGMLASLEDETIRGYFGFTGPEMSAAVTASVETMRTFEGQRAFVIEGNRHVLLSRPTLETSDGVSVRQWVQAFASDDPSWDTVGP